MSERPYPFEKNRYYYGKMLTSADFQAEQRYNEYKRMFLNQMVLGRGVLCGLGVRMLDERTLLIESGAAVDGAGREITVPGDTVKKLSAFEGYDSLAKQKAVLYVRYREETAQPVCVVNRKAEQDEYEDNRIREKYEFFLADCQERQQSGPDADFFVEALLSGGPDYAVSLRMPAVVSRGRRVRLSLLVEKLSDEESSLSLSGVLKLPAFLTAEGAQELHICEEDIVLECGAFRTYDHWLYASEVEFDSTTILWDVDASAITVDGSEAECEPDPELPLRLTDRTPEELIKWRVGQKSLEEKNHGNEEEAVRLAEISIADEAHDHVLREVREFGVKRYIPVPESEEICREYLSYYSEHAEYIRDMLPAAEKKEEEIPAREAEAPVIRGGTLEIPLDVKMKKGKICYSEEIIHGLGPGNVYVDVGICNVDDGAGSRNKSDTVVYGDTGLFEGKNRQGISAQTAVKVFEARGSFQVAARLTGEQNTIVLPLRWTAVRVPDGTDTDGEDGNMQIVPETPTVRLSQGEKHYFSVRFKNMLPCTLKYELMEDGGGEIGPDGIYTAPAKAGIYEIRISCADHRSVCTYVYAVVGGKE